MKRSTYFLAGLVILLAPIMSVHASLIGDTVGCTATEVGVTGFQCAPATAVVVGGFVPEFSVTDGGTRKDNGMLLNVNISEALINLSNFDAIEGIDFLPGDVLAFDDLDWTDFPSGAIVGATLNASFTDLMQSDISFTANSVTIDLGDTVWAAESVANIALDVVHTGAVPEPATLALLGLGLVGLGFTRRRRLEA